MIMHCDRGVPDPTLTFWGAAQTVTGSMHLVEVGDERLFLDCGTVCGVRRPPRPDVSFPVPPETLDAVVLSHAHIDHCGSLPALVRQGFTGPIYCTPATRELIGLMLADSARVQEEEERVACVLAGPSGSADLRPRSAVQQVIWQCVEVPYGKPVSLTPHAELSFADAGHILGSAQSCLTLAGPGRDVRVTFTGDIGRSGLPFLHDTAPLPPADLVVSECTYGGRRHQTVEQMAAIFSRVVRRSADEGSVVLVPAFSLGRTQLVVHYLRRWMADGLLPRLPLFVDSPLAADIALVHARYPEAFHPSATPDAEAGLPPAVYLRTLDESEELVERRGPSIIVASGGMCDGGRIVRHLRRHIDDPRATLALVSYQAPGSLGRRLLERAPTVRFHGRSWNKWIDVVEVNGFSGHADHDDLLDHLSPLAGRARVRLVHGEVAAAELLAADLRRRGFLDVAVPARDDMVTIT